MPSRRSVIAALPAALLSARATHADAAQTRAPAAPRSAIKVEQLAGGLDHPWGLQVLPDNDLLVTERPGRLRIIPAKDAAPITVAGVPEVWANGQGGLLDVALAPEFTSSGLIVLTYAERRQGGGGTTVATAVLVRDGASARLDRLSVIFRQQPAFNTGMHFGSRLAFDREGRVFVTLGERGIKEAAQDLGRHNGKVVRLNLDGSIPADNPVYPGSTSPNPIWSYGHRNPQAAALHPGSGKLWVVEHGPQGGDEVNIALAGRNYGWPIIGYGIDYSGARLHASTHREGMEQPLYYWAPSIAPSGMAFCTADLFPAWKGNLLVGALAGQALHCLVLDGESVVGEEVLLADQRQRIRDVRQAPDGSILLLTDDRPGSVLRVRPA